MGTEDSSRNEILRWRGSLIVSLGFNLVLVLMLIMQMSMTAKFRNLTNGLADTGNAAVQAAAAWEKATRKPTTTCSYVSIGLIKNVELLRRAVQAFN